MRTSAFVFAAALAAALVLLSVGTACRAQNFWEPANGSPVGPVAAVVIANNGNLVVSTFGGYGGLDSIYLSSDNGVSWSSTDGPGGVSVILNSPNSFLYAEYSCCTNIYRSTDNGGHWITFFTPHGDGHSMAIDSLGRIICSGLRETWDTIYQPHQTTEVLYFDTAVLEISSDEGQTWSETPLLSSSDLVPYYDGNSPPFISSIMVGKNGTIFAQGSTGAIFQSKDGVTWVKLDTTFNSEISTLAMSPQGTLFAGTSSGLFRLDDTNWTKVGNLDSAIYSINVDHRGIIYVLTHQGSFPGGSDESGLLRSTDGGVSWTSIQKGLGDLTDNWGSMSSAVYCVAVPSDDRIFVGTPGALYCSTNEGTNWNAITHGLSFVANDLGFPTAIISSARHLIVWTSGGLYKSTDDGETWNILPITLDTLTSLASAGNFIFVRTDTGYLRSSDDGLSWKPINEGLALKDSSGEYFGFSSILSDPLGDLFLQSNFANFVMYVSTNYGTTWQQSEFENTNFNVFTSSSDGSIWGGGDGGIFQSTDRGAHWQQMNNGLFDTDVYALTTDRNGNLFAATYSLRIFRSTNNGNSWQYLTTLDTPNTGRSILVVDSNNNLYFGMSGILRSTDNGQTWDQENSGLRFHGIGPMVVSSSGRIFAGTDLLYRSIRTYNNAVQPADLLPSSVFSQNSPNPFVSSTDISFTLPEPSFVTLTLFDATGRKIATLASEYMNSGSHSISFERGNLLAGVYFYRLAANGTSEMRALVIE